MAFLAVLDACALYPFVLRDSLLRLAALELYDVKWSDEIIDEMRRNLVANHAVDVDKANRTVALMNVVFEDAVVPAERIDQLIPAMTNAEEDRHVLAAAEVVVTFNLKELFVECTHPRIHRGENM